MGRGRGRSGEGSSRRCAGIAGVDQYGETFASQDRDSHAGGHRRELGSKGLTGGGEAGGGKRESNVTYVRQLPKFLQGHAHLLGRKGEDSPALVERKRFPDGGGSEDDEDEDKEAMQRAVAEDPSLAQQYPELASVVAKGEAAAEKERGNAAFAAQRYEDAVASFTKCIAWDPQNEVYFSNRAAALTALRRYEEALADGKRATVLKPRWAKGWARVGAAYGGLEEPEEARKAYERALELEPDDQGLQDARHRADVAARKAEGERRHRFKRSLEGSRPRDGQATVQQAAQRPVESAAGVEHASNNTTAQAACLSLRLKAVHRFDAAMQQLDAACSDEALGKNELFW